MINVDEYKVIDLVLSFSNRKNPKFKMSNKKEILKLYNEYSERTFDLKQLANGHDLMNITMETLKLILRKDNCKHNIQEVAELENILCMHYIPSREFYNTQLYNDIRVYLKKQGMENLLVS